MITYTIRCQSSEFYWRKLIYSNLRTPLALTHTRSRSHLIVRCQIHHLFTHLVIRQIVHFIIVWGISAFIFHSCSVIYPFISFVNSIELCTAITSDLYTTRSNSYSISYALCPSHALTFMFTRALPSTYSQLSIGDDIPTIIPVLQH